MKIVLINFLVVLCCFTAQANSWSDVYPSVKPSIPMIMSSGSLCAGALIEKDLILTAAHCVNRMRPIALSWFGAAADFESAKVVELNTKLDLALIKLEKPNARKVLPLLVRGQRTPEGSAIATIGHPSVGKLLGNPPFDTNMTYLMSAGILSGWSEEDFISDMSVSPGNSGGPVFNDKGEVIGVVSRKRVDRYVGAIGFSASLSKVYEMLDNYHDNKTPEITWRSASSSASVYVAYSNQSYLENYGGRKVWYFGLDIDVKDRLRLGFSDNFSNTHGFQDYSLGYKFAYELQNHGVVYITPSVDFLHYHIKLDDTTEFDKRVTGGSLSLSMSAMPIGLKYIGATIDGDYQSIFALQAIF